MTMFEDRERAFEAKWAHDEEVQFRILVRRNELLGQWAAAELRLAEAEQERYVAALVALALKNKAIDALFLKLKTDLGAAHGDAAILRKMDEFLDAATLDAGSVQRRALGDGKADLCRAGESADNVTHVDFAQLLSATESGGADQDAGMQVRMLRKISRRSPD